MITLNDVMNKNQEIIQTANELGFDKVYIYKFKGDSYLNLVVEPFNEQINSFHANTLETLLNELLSCHVVILQKNRIKPLYKDDVLSKSVLLTEIDKVKDLFGPDHSSIAFNAIEEIENLTDYDKYLLNRRIKNDKELAFELIEQVKNLRISLKSDSILSPAI